MVRHRVPARLVPDVVLGDLVRPALPHYGINVACRSGAIHLDFLPDGIDRPIVRVHLLIEEGRFVISEDSGSGDSFASQRYVVPRIPRGHR